MRTEAGRPEADPAVKAIHELNDSMSVSFEALEKDDRELRARVDKLEQATNAGFSAHASRIDNVERGRIYPGGRGVNLSWVPEAQRESIVAVAERSMKPGADRSALLLSDAEFRAASIAWFLASTMAQSPKLSGVNQAQWMELVAKGHSAFGVPIEKAAAFITTTDTLGGHWLPDPVANEVFRLVTDNSVFLRLGRSVPMESKTLDLPVEGSSALTAAFGTEGADITDSVPASNALNKVTLTAERLAGYAESSLEAVQDSAASILDFVLTVLTEKSGREIDKQVLEGTGSPFTGLSGNSSVNELATAANGDAISYAILSEMVYKARERASRDNAHFFVAPEIMQKITGLVDSTGQPIFRFGSVPQAIPSTLLGFPVEVHSVIKADRTYGTGTGHSNLYFGPPSAVVVGNRVPMSWDTAREGALFKSYGIAMRLVMRVGAAIAVPKAFTRKIQVKAV